MKDITPKPPTRGRGKWIALALLAALAAFMYVIIIIKVVKFGF